MLVAALFYYLVFYFVIAIAAIDRAAFARFKWYLGILAALGTYGGEFL
jgi:hypothetical protein